MKILYVIHPKSKAGTWEQSGDTNLATQLIKSLPADIEVDLFCDISKSTEDELQEYKKLYRISNFVDSSPYITRRVYLKDSMKYVASISKNYDIIHFHNATVSSIKWMNELFSDEDKLVYTMHTPPDTGTSFGLYHGKDYYTFSNSNNRKLVAVSRSHYIRVFKTLRDILVEKEEVSTINPKLMLPNLTYILNGVSEESFTSDDPRCVDVAVIGRLDASKDILKSLEAATYAFPKGTIVYVGDNPKDSTSVQNDEYYNEVVRFINRNGINWIKKASNQSVKRLLAKSKLHISLSKIETFGLTVAEAMMQNTPVLGFDQGGIGESIVNGVNGYKLESVKRKTWVSYLKDIPYLAQKCLSIDERNSYSIREYAKERFSIKTMTDKYVSLYNEMVVR